MLDLGLSLGIAVLGGYLADKRKIPAAYMIGALFAVALFQIFFERANLPSSFRFLTQTATGTFLGAKFQAEDIKALRKVLFPGILMTFLMIAFSFGIAYLLSAWLGMDPLSSVFSSSPGGLMDISLIAYEFEANTSQVALLQLIRLISVITIVPFIAKKCREYVLGKEQVSKERDREKERAKESRKSQKEIRGHKEENKSWKDLCFTLCIGFVAGLLGYYTKIPAGAMSFSMLVVAIYNIKTERAYMPLSLRKVIQSVGGALIGSRVSMADVLALPTMLPPILLVVVAFSVMNLIIGFLLYRYTRFSISTALLSAAPGGMSDIAIMAEDLGANGIEVAMMQFIRASSIIVVYPLLISLFFRA